MEDLSDIIFDRSCCPVCLCTEKSSGRVEKDGPCPGSWDECKNCGLLYENPAFFAKCDVKFRKDVGSLPAGVLYDPTHVKIVRALSGSQAVKPWWDLYDYIESRIMPFGPDRELLIEVGCGAGELLSYIYGPRYAAKQVVGFEICRDCVLFCKSRGYETYYHDISLGLTIQAFEGKADIIVCNEVMEHVLNPLGFIKGISKYLSNNGIAWIKFARPDDIETLHSGEWHYWTMTAICKLLESNGLSILSSYRGSTFYDIVVKKQSGVLKHINRGE